MPYLSCVMKKESFSLGALPSFLIFSTLLLSQAGSANGSRTLHEWWRLEKKKEVHDYSNIPKNRHVYFVPGIMNELSAIPGLPNLVYYKDNKSVVKKLGMSSSYSRQDSSRPIPENAKRLFKKINETYQSEKKPLILVGHSKGAAEILYCLLEHPELILGGKVDRVILFQAALGGSPLADGDLGFILKMVGLAPIDLLRPNLKTLSTREAERNFNQAFYDYENYFQPYQDRKDNAVFKMKKMVSDRIFYVRSAAAPKDLSFAIDLVLHALLKPKGLALKKEIDASKKNSNPTLKDAAETFLASKYSGLNDGLLPVESQWDRRIGTDLGILEGDHAAFTVGIVTATWAKQRKALMRAIMNKIYEAPSQTQEDSAETFAPIFHEDPLEEVVEPVFHEEMIEVVN